MASKKPKDCVFIEVPVHPVDLKAYATNRADVRCKTARQSYALKMLTESLMRRATRLSPTVHSPEGTLVNSPATALMWLLEQVAERSELAQIGLPK